jgi:2-iminobutanoate/2-iminopropanoate deaminase
MHFYVMSYRNIIEHLIYRTELSQMFRRGVRGRPWQDGGGWKKHIRTFTPHTSPSMKTIISTPHAPAAIGPYSQAVAAGGFLYTSGQIALDPATGQLDMADIATETHRVMQNLKALLLAGGADFTHVVKTTIYMSDMAHYATVNEVYASYFTAAPPAREAVQVAGLPKGVNVEISVVAFLG